MEYQYSKKNHFKYAEKYQMTPFKNKEFLIEYKKSRERNLHEFDKKSDEIKYFKDIIFKTEKEKWKDIKNNSINTEKLLKFLFIEIIKKSEKSEILLNKIIKKFEIKKKIFESYDLEFKEKSKKDSNLKNYLLLSIICLFKYQKTKNLKFLNTSLKINDLISSQQQKICNLDEISLYSFAIKKELEIIEIIMIKKGVSND